MHGTAGADLPAGEYRITPSRKTREEYGLPVGELLSEGLDSVLESAEEGEFHKYDVERADGTPALLVFEKHGEAEYDWLPFSVPQYVYLFVDPDGDPRLVLEVDHGWYPSYSIVEPGTTDDLGTVRKSSRVIGDWQLRAPDGRAVATAETTGTLGNLFSFSTHVTFDVSGPNGERIAQFERVRADGDVTDRFRSVMEVSCSPSAVSTEQCLAFAFALLYQGTQKTSSGSSGGP